MRTKHHINQQRVKGKSTRICRSVRKGGQTGDGLLGNLVRGGLRFARKYATEQNLKRAGQSIMRIIRQNGEDWWKDQRENIGAQVTKVGVKALDDLILNNKSVKEVANSTVVSAKAAAKSFKPTVRKSVADIEKQVKRETLEAMEEAEPDFKREIIDPASELLLSNIIGEGMKKKKRKPRKRKQIGSGIKKI